MHCDPAIRRFVPAHLLLLGLALSAGGCTTAPKSEPPPAVAPSGSAYGSGQGAATAGLESAGTRYAGPWEDPANPLYQRIIYFDYDSAKIRPEDLPVMRTHAAYLGNHPDTKVMLEGHTDERGTREYNLALSDQRATAVRDLMIADGVRSQQLTTLGYGEERPADPGHDEPSWRLNRRVVIEY